MSITASPCIGICLVDEKGTCIGCHRTLDEIGIWSRASDAQKRQVLLAAELRLQAKQVAPACLEANQCENGPGNADSNDGL